MSYFSSQLTRNQKRAIASLLENRRISDAAIAVGLSERTIYRWLTDPTFTFALRSAELAAISEAVRTLIVDLMLNHETMRVIRDNENESAYVRLRAAQILDNSLLRWRGMQNIEDRLVNLESIINGMILIDED